MNYFNYFSEIEETFVRRRGKNLLLSPLDWALIEAWKEREIPLHVVLRAIENIFDQSDQQLAARKRAIKSLVYCRDEVENLFAAWLDAQTGSAAPNANSPKDDYSEPEIPVADVIIHLQKITDNLERPRLVLNGKWADLSEKILTLLQRLKNDFTASQNLESLQAKLSEIDNRIDQKLPDIFSENEFNQIKDETTSQLRSHKNRMSESVYADTFNNLLIKNLRNRADLPRFSLFYL